MRLSILDPDPRSHQPFRYYPARGGGVMLSYNGECWGYRGLREELRALGHEFDTTGDTEVVAAAFSEWGLDALRRLDGQFALAVTLEGSSPFGADDGTYLARDRFGEVPLYMLQDGDGGLFGSGVLWASERKAFGDRGAEAVPVPPGCYVEVATGRVRAFYGPRAPRTHDLDLRAEVGVALERGAHERLQSDVPVCTLLSGGLDSCAVLALIKDVKPDVVAYTASMDATSVDLEAARYAADYYGVELREVQVGPIDLNGVRRAIAAIEIPMKAQVEIALLCIPLARQIAEDGFKVVLSGEGADELFGGYGNLARKATSDESWKAARRYSFEKMARGNFVRTNKTFMAAGVEARLPFMDRGLVELVLALNLAQCPPGKKLLKDAMSGVVPERIRDRQKATFQGASGVSGYLDGLLSGKQVRHYNDVARELFGGLPRG